MRSNPCVQFSFLLVCKKHRGRSNHINSSQGQLDLLIDAFESTEVKELVSWGNCVSGNIYFSVIDFAI